MCQGEIRHSQEARRSNPKDIKKQETVAMPCMERSGHQDQKPSNSTISRVTSLQFMELFYKIVEVILQKMSTMMIL